MGILTNALEQLTGQILGLGFGQLDDYFTRKIQSGRVEEAAREAAETDNEINQRLLMMQNVNQGTFGVPGIGDTTGQTVNPQSPQGQGVLSKLGTLPEIPAAIGQSPLHASLIEHRGKQFIDQNPIVQQMKQREEIQKEILRASGKKVDQNLLGLDELEPTFRDPSLLPRERILQNLGEREFTETTGTERAKEPGRQQRFQERLQLKQSPTYKQMTGGGGGGEGGSFNVPGEFLNRAEKEIMRDKSGVYVTTPEAQQSMFTPEQISQNPALAVVDLMKGGSKEKPALTDRGLRVMQIAEEIAAKSKNRQPLSIINEAKAREKKEFAETQKKEFVGPPAPTTPAAPERAKEVQTGRDPATENKIRVLRQKGITPEQIKQALKEEGKNPADYGY